MNRILTLAFKDLLILWRDKAGLFWVLGFPVLMAALFGSIFSDMGNQASKMKVALIDRDGSESSRAFVEKLRASAALEVKALPQKQAQERVRTGDIVAFVVVPKGFGETTSFFSGQGPSLEVGIDPSRKAEAGYLQGILAEASFSAMASQFSDPAKMRSQLRQAEESIASAPGMDAAQKRNLRRFIGDIDRYYRSPAPATTGGTVFSGPQLKQVPVIPEKQGPESAFEISFPQAIVWGLIGVVASFSLSIVRERIGGTLLRLRVAPLSRSQILAGKGLGCFLACTIVILLLLALGGAVFGVRFHQPGLLALAIVSTSLCFVGLMMLLSVLGRTEQAVSGSGWAVMMIMAMFGGGMIPLIAMPAWMLRAGSASPIKWAVLSLEGAIWRGFSLREMLLPCGILLGVGLVFFTIGVRLLARVEE